MEKPPDWTLKLTDRDAKLINSQNKEGLTWLQILVKRGDVKALDAIFSPHRGLAWDLSLYAIDEDGFALLKHSVQESNDITMQQIFDSFVSFRRYRRLCTSIEHILPSSTEEKLLENDRSPLHLLQGTDAPEYAKRLTRFFNDWHGYNGHLEDNPFCRLAGYGFSTIFKLLYEADETVFGNIEYSLKSKEDMSEYIQPELLVDWEEAPFIRDADVWTACTIGKTLWWPLYVTCNMNYTELLMLS